MDKTRGALQCARLDLERATAETLDHGTYVVIRLFVQYRLYAVQLRVLIEWRVRFSRTDGSIGGYRK